MLLAKIKEKLFNRRNKVEIESLEGELPESFKESLIPFIQQNGFNETYLTHSFNELDSTLKGIVGDAINDNWTNGVACTEAQWNAIRKLLDKSLYLYYEGLYEPYSLNKILTNGINIYKFGTQGVKFGCTIELKYDYSTNLLYAIVAES